MKGLEMSFLGQDSRVANSESDSDNTKNGNDFSFKIFSNKCSKYKFYKKVNHPTIC